MANNDPTRRAASCSAQKPLYRHSVQRCDEQPNHQQALHTEVTERCQYGNDNDDYGRERQRGGDTYKQELASPR